MLAIPREKSAHFMIAEIMSGAQTYTIKMDAKYNTGGKHNKYKLDERAAETCYFCSIIGRKAK